MRLWKVGRRISRAGFTCLPFLTRHRHSRSRLLLFAVLSWATSLAADNSTCFANARSLHRSDPPYENYFYSDCHLITHVVVTSPLRSSNLSAIGPRLLIAWPAGNSSIVFFFQPKSGENGALGIQLENSTITGEMLDPIYDLSETPPGNPKVGVFGLISFNSSAILTIPYWGEFGPLENSLKGQASSIPLTWLDNITTTFLSFSPINGSDSVTISRGVNTTLSFGTESCQFNASFEYPKLEQLNPQEVLNNVSTDLIDEGEDGAIVAVIAAALELINKSDGSVCHEENVGDYATFLNLQNNITSTAPQCDYKMVDTHYFLPIVMKNYFVVMETGQDRSLAFLKKTASFLTNRIGLAYAELTQFTAHKVMNTSAPFASEGDQKKDNLIHLKERQVVGQWRDLEIGIGGGRILYDVNTALVPAALRSIAVLSRAGFFPNHPEWSQSADRFADVWEDETLNFFEVSIPQSTPASLVEPYSNEISSYSGPSRTEDITSGVKFYGLALDGNNNQSIVRVLNTHACFRYFLLNTTNQTQLSSFLNQTSEHILQPFAIGLSSSVGLFVANPACGGGLIYAKNFTNANYHGTIPLGTFTPTESDIRQLWCLTFLALHRENPKV
ncbi:uncharacterized protein BDR25DRAFT_370740 [Lindgomyces ingoldianus]|uniref:Uncharacterized protein n=1 Tax=Lindgomyces ingoldianus TaxID=673940 RepID=A0ACB6RDW3_9PLEO|nr:uncharacterized protein BDR25DRAFT_370740 [Lindgomyces ingoldianus]KAF2476933.1 hypothetical protein BDR25DRAFT_370740 [Lindgomyces ingoldianus]